MYYYDAQQRFDYTDKDESNRAFLYRRWIRQVLQVALVAALLLSGCSDDEESALALPRFSEVAAESGIEFRHFNGAAGSYHYPETHGSGAAFADFNGDGFSDLYVVNSAAIHGALTAHLPANALFVNQTDGTFVNRAAEAGVADTSFGMGVGVGDIDNDGHADLYVTNWGCQPALPKPRQRSLCQTSPNGRGPAICEYRRARPSPTSISTVIWTCMSPTDVRIVGDDLPECYRGLIQIYCGPRAYPGDSGSLFRNDGNLRFTETSPSQ